MNPLLLLVAGFALLAGCVFVGRLLTTNTLLGTRLGLGLFLPVWLSTMAFFVWMSVSRDGVPFASLAPMATLVFIVPAMSARFNARAMRLVSRLAVMVAPLGIDVL